MKTIILLIILAFSFNIKSDGDPKFVIDKYLKYVGGIEKIKQIKDLTIYSTFEIFGSKYTQVTYFKYPQKLLTITTHREKEKFRTLLFDNKMIRVLQSNLPIPVTIEASGKYAKINLLRANPFQELLFDKYKIATEQLDLAGIVTYERQVPVIPVRCSNNEITWTNFYHIESCIKMGSLWSITTRVDDLTKTETCFEEYSDFKFFGGINFPTKTRTTLNGKQYSVLQINNIEINQNISDKVFQIEK